MTDDIFNLQIQEKEENQEMTFKNGSREAPRHSNEGCSSFNSHSIHGVNLDTSKVFEPKCTSEVCKTDCVKEDFHLQCDNLRASMRREKMCREEVEKEEENILMELKTLQEKCKEDTVNYSEVKEKLLQDSMTKQHKINRLSIELKEVSEALKQRNKRLEEVRRTEQYWKEEVQSLRNEISHMSKESLVFCSEVDRLKKELKWRETLLKNCKCQVIQILSQSRNEKLCHLLQVPRLEEKLFNMTQEEEMLFTNQQQIENSSGEKDLVPVDGNGLYETTKLDENDSLALPKDEDQSCYQDATKKCNCQDNIIKLQAEMEKLNNFYTTEKEESLHLLGEKEKEIQELHQKVIELECTMKKLESENKDMKKTREVNFKSLQSEKERVTALQQQVEFLKQYNSKICASFKVKHKKTVIRGKQHAQELKKKVEGIMQKQFSFEEHMLKETCHLRARVKNLLLDNSELKSALNDKEECLSAVKVDLIKAREVLKTEVYINSILSERNKAMQDELSLCRNKMNCATKLPVCKNTYSPAFRDILKKWCSRMQEAHDKQTALCMLDSDKTWISPNDTDIKSFAQKNAKLLRLELFEMENSWLHGLLDNFHRKWMENISGLKPVAMKDVSEEINHSYLHAQALIEMLDQGEIPFLSQNGGDKLFISEDRKMDWYTDEPLLNKSYSETT